MQSDFTFDPIKLYFRSNQTKVQKCLHAFTILQGIDYKSFTCEGVFTRLHIIMSSKSVKACEGAFTQNDLYISRLRHCEGVKALFKLNEKEINLQQESKIQLHNFTVM